MTTLQLSVDNQVTTVLHNATKYAVGISGSFTENWWDEPDGLRGKQVGAYNACMTWTDGGRACTGWLYSLTVQL